VQEHFAGTVGPTSDPHVLTAPASQPAGGIGGALFTGAAAVPQALSLGTQTLVCSPLYVVSDVHVVLEEHSSPLGQGGAQKVSPWNCAHTPPPVQSASVVHSVQEAAEPEEPDEPGVLSPPPEGFADDDVDAGDGADPSVAPDAAHPTDQLVANPRPATTTVIPNDATRDIRISRMSTPQGRRARFAPVIQASHPARLNSFSDSSRFGARIARVRPKAHGGSMPSTLAPEARCGETS
jgi:hypothetical protein